MTEQSPAPWKDEGDGVVIAANGKQVASVFPFQRDVDMPLICAAPETTAERDRLKTINADLLVTLSEIKDMVENLPSGIDPDADENNLSPADMTAHIGGLICKMINVVIARAALSRAKQE